MATGVEELVDMLFDMIDEAKNAPLSSEKCIIERDKALDLLDDIKAQFPVELAEARKISTPAMSMWPPPNGRLMRSVNGRRSRPGRWSARTGS